MTASSLSPAPSPDHARRRQFFRDQEPYLTTGRTFACIETAVAIRESEEGALFVRGWLFDEQATISTLTLRFFGVDAPGVVVFSLRREDVAQAFGCERHAGASGFVATFYGMRSRPLPRLMLEYVSADGACVAFTLPVAGPSLGFHHPAQPMIVAPSEKLSESDAPIAIVVSGTLGTHSATVAKFVSESMLLGEPVALFADMQVGEAVETRVALERASQSPRLTKHSLCNAMGSVLRNGSRIKAVVLVGDLQCEFLQNVAHTLMASLMSPLILWTATATSQGSRPVFYNGAVTFLDSTEGKSFRQLLESSLGKRGKLCHEAHRPMVVGPP